MKAPIQRRIVRRGPGKGGKKNKKKQVPSTVQNGKLEEVPLESYRIIDDTEGIITDYLMAVYSLLEEAMRLRSFVAKAWQDVASCGLNSATAGALTNMAVAIVQRTEAAIFIDFPGHESYETVLKTITRGDMKWAKTSFGVHVDKVPSGSDRVEEVSQHYIDIEEQFMAHTYQYLVDFVTDFQTNRNGKPTKRMAAEIANWDPTFKPQQASKEKRMQWRRSFTIKWLYDLVNVFSSIVIQRITLKGEKHVLENVDWSMTGIWNVHRRLFGLNELAGFVTSLAMQKPGTNIRPGIMPNHVFQLQCILDSLTVTRGWLHTLIGHKLEAPPALFRPRCDVDLFLDRENERSGHGLLQAVEVLGELFEKDAHIHGQPDRHTAKQGLLELAFEDFRDWLGESMYMFGLQTIPPSRFSSSNANGLWEYCPLLCGAGLMEALEMSYTLSMMVWDRSKEPILIIHLHNMLVERGYIKKEVGLYMSLQELFPTSFFAGGKAPKSDFLEAFQARLKEGTSRANNAKAHAGRQKSRTAADLHGLMASWVNTMFQKNSNLLLYREASWNPTRIPDNALASHSCLTYMRLAQTPVEVDAAGHQRLERTELVDKVLKDGLSEDYILNLRETLTRVNAKKTADNVEYAALSKSMLPDFDHEDPATVCTLAIMPCQGRISSGFH